MESKVFVSYSRKDSTEVKAVVDIIEESLGIKCWIDLKGIKSSSVYEDEVINAIENCEIVLFMISPNSIASDYVRSEINYAFSKERRIILICLNDSRPDKWALLKFPNVDYIRASNEDHMNKLIHDMEGWLEIQAIGPVLKEIKQLLEEWKKLEHEQKGIFQHIVEKEVSIGNRDTSASDTIKSYSKGTTQDKKEIDQEKEQLKKQVSDLQKELSILKNKEVPQLTKTSGLTQAFVMKLFHNSKFGGISPLQINNFWLCPSNSQDFLVKQDSIETVIKKFRIDKKLPDSIITDIPNLAQLTQMLNDKEILHPLEILSRRIWAYDENQEACIFLFQNNHFEKAVGREEWGRIYLVLTEIK